jgi:hypothetical protein
MTQLLEMLGQFWVCKTLLKHGVSEVHRRLEISENRKHMKLKLSCFRSLETYICEAKFPEHRWFENSWKWGLISCCDRKVISVSASYVGSGRHDVGMLWFVRDHFHTLAVNAVCN